jgi:D-3-phosphoglycerate dehydrogenase
MAKLKKMGKVVFNDTDKPFSRNDLIDAVKDVDICLTDWQCAAFSPEVLHHAPRLKLIAHAGGSVANIASDRVYEREIKVCSANDIMAKYVAEGAFAYMLAGLRLIPQHDRRMKNRQLWNKMTMESGSLFGAKLGLIGLGTVGGFLLDLLKPFEVSVKLYDPYINRDFLQKFPNVELAPLEVVLAWGSIISVHASLTPETYHLLDQRRISQMKDGALFINTARGKIVDEQALTQQLSDGRIRAVLDVYEKEPPNEDSRLRELDNVILMPHMAAAPSREEMTFAMIEEIERFMLGKDLKREVTFEKYKLMTRNVRF